MWTSGRNALKDQGEGVTYCSLKNENDEKDAVDDQHGTQVHPFWR